MDRYGSFVEAYCSNSPLDLHLYCYKTFVAHKIQQNCETSVLRPSNFKRYSCFCNRKEKLCSVRKRLLGNFVDLTVKLFGDHFLHFNTHKRPGILFEYDVNQSQKETLTNLLYR